MIRGKMMSDMYVNKVSITQALFTCIIINFRKLKVKCFE